MLSITSKQDFKIVQAPYYLFILTLNLFNFSLTQLGFLDSKVTFIFSNNLGRTSWFSMSGLSNAKWSWGTIHTFIGNLST